MGRFWNALGQLVTSINSLSQNLPINLSEGKSTIVIDINSLALVPGRYRLAGGFRRNGEVLGWARDLAHFDVMLRSNAEFSEGMFMMPAAITLAPNFEQIDKS